MRKTIIFDLDFTLYDMYQYLKPAFEGVAHVVSDIHGLNTEDVHDKLIMLANQHGWLDEKLFNKLLDSFEINTPENIELCVKAFHTFPPKELTLYDGVEDLLTTLNENNNLMIVTDGKSTTQQMKMNMLGIEGFFKEIIYTHDYGLSKPGIFSGVIKNYKLDPQNCYMIGDHPVKDIYGAAKYGMTTIRVMQGAFKNLPEVVGFAPDFCVDDIKDVIKYLNCE